jgi:divalent metal cation (Fe/Co/Zn/Cd) transporter
MAVTEPSAEPSCAAEPTAAATERDAGWLRAARWARRLAWISLVWMCIEGAVGLWQGVVSGSISLTGWALGSAVEGLASVLVVWRFTGARTLSQTAERRAQRGVAVSFWLIAPYIAAQSVVDLLTGHRAEGSLIGIVLTAVALLVVLAITQFWSGGWWLDPVIGLGIAAVAVREGIEAWRGEDCGC